MGADKMLVKPMQTRALIQSIEKLLESHQARLKKLEKSGVAASLAAGFAAGVAAGKLDKPAPVKAGKKGLRRVRRETHGKDSNAQAQKAGPEEVGRQKLLTAPQTRDIPPARNLRPDLVLAFRTPSEAKEEASAVSCFPLRPTASAHFLSSPRNCGKLANLNKDGPKVVENTWLNHPDQTRRIEVDSKKPLRRYDEGLSNLTVTSIESIF